MPKPLTLYLVPLTTLETGFADPGFEAYSTEDIDEQIRNNPYSQVECICLLTSVWNHDQLKNFNYTMMFMVILVVTCVQVFFFDHFKGNSRDVARMLPVVLLNLMYKPDTRFWILMRIRKCCWQT